MWHPTSALCKIKSALLLNFLLKVLLFTADNVLQVPQEANLLPAEGHLISEFFYAS